VWKLWGLAFRSFILLFIFIIFNLLNWAYSATLSAVGFAFPGERFTKPSDLFTIPYAFRSFPFFGLGSSVGAGVVHRAFLYTDGAARARLAAHFGRAHDVDFCTYWLGENTRCISSVH
jgi:hypothetical protein